MVFSIILKNGSIYDSFDLFPRDRNAPFPGEEPPPEGSARLFNADTDSCLQFDQNQKEAISFHGECENSERSYLQLVPHPTDSQYFQIKNLLTDTCLFFSNKWLFFGKEKSFWEKCDGGDSRQYFRRSSPGSQGFRIVNQETAHCLHFSGFFRTDNSELHAYHQECSDSGKEWFRFLP